MWVFPVGPGEVHGQGFQIHSSASYAPMALEDPREYGKNGASTEPTFLGTHQICPLPSCRDESELVLVLNGHILELTQSLLEQVLTGPSEIAAGRGTKVR